MKQPPFERPHYAQLDGLRGIAILMVLVCHLFPVLPLSTWGRLGVDLFFVLSGFLITDGLLFTRWLPNFRKLFYAKRALRIFPLYYATLFLLFILTTAEPTLQLQSTYLQRQQIFFLLQLQNWIFIFKPVPGQRLIFEHLWSLGFEEQFYLIWPLVLPLVATSKRPLKLLFCCLLSLWVARLAINLSNPANGIAFRLIFYGRPDGLFIGSFIAIWRMNARQHLIKKLGWLLAIASAIEFILLLIRSFLHLELSHFLIVGHTVVALTFGILLVCALQSSNEALKRLLTNPALAFFGKISFSLYLLHWPISVILGKGFRADWSKSLSPDMVSILLGFISLILAIAVSTISYLSIEQYFLKRRQSISRLLLK